MAGRGATCREGSHSSGVCLQVLAPSTTDTGQMGKWAQVKKGQGLASSFLVAPVPVSLATMAT